MKRIEICIMVKSQCVCCLKLLYSIMCEDDLVTQQYKYTFISHLHCWVAGLHCAMLVRSSIAWEVHSKRTGQCGRQNDFGHSLYNAGLGRASARSPRATGLCSYAGKGSCWGSGHNACQLIRSGRQFRNPC